MAIKLNVFQEIEEMRKKTCQQNVMTSILQIKRNFYKTYFNTFCNVIITHLYLLVVCIMCMKKHV